MTSEQAKREARALYAAKCIAGAVPYFNRLALVPIEGRSFVPMRDDRSIANK